MSYTYKGTKITGTGSGNKSGYAATASGQTYFNTDSGHVYTSSRRGKASEAIWRYSRTDICGKPILGVKGLGAPTRSNGYKMTAKWSVPKDLTKTTNGKRAQGLEIDWILGITGKDPKNVTTTANESRTESTINLNNFVAGRTYTRASFYPNTKKKLTYVSVQVRPYNSKGKGKVVAKETRHFTKPREPKIGAFSFNTSSGEVTTTITTNAGDDYQERYDTRYKVIVKNTRTDNTTTYRDADSRSTSINITYDASDYSQLSYGQYIKITVKAWARGFAGDSDTVTKSYYVSYPAQATIGAPKVTGKTSSDKCTIVVKTNNSEAHPVDGVRLEYLPNVSYTTKTSIPGDSAWTSTDIMDDAQCTALAMPVADLMPDAGLYTWVRVKSWHASETVLYRYSDYQRVKKLETPAPTAADDDIKILDTTAGADGQSISVVLGWNADGQDDSTGTELTWSEEADTWKSTKAPEEHTFTWSDGSRTQGGVTYHDSATIVIKDLEEATKYYIRARRYLEGDTTTYSSYSNTATCITSETPEAVVASCARYVAVGSALQVYWTFSGYSLQTAWQIVTSNRTVIANGEGSMTSTQISAERLAKFATNNVITFTVQVSTGSGFVVSESHTVTIVEEPELVLTVPTTLTAQPFEFEATCNRLCDLTIIVSSHGSVGQSPVGLLRQASGDTVYSTVLVPIWTEGGNDFTTTVTLPSGLDFWDLGLYQLSVVATDRETELQSAEVLADFSVEWTHQAPDPADAVTITAIDTTDDETGRHTQAVEITLTAPTNSVSTDVYDIYRLTGDGAYLIGCGRRC